MSIAYITPSIIEWARERSQDTIESVAKKAHVKPEQLNAWEEEKLYPTFRQARNLAKALRIPFGYLFLSSPPNERVVLPDLRTIGGSESSTLSLEFVDLLDSIILKQEWFKEFLETTDQNELPIIGKYGINDDYKTIASDIAEYIGITEELRNSSPNWEEYLRSIIELIEEKNILVLRNGVVGNNTHRKLSISEFRGFAISDNLAPVIFINNCDAKAAQIFTLAHELAHLWIGESGISNLDLGNPQIGGDMRIEYLCNKVAAELLVPRDNFLADIARGLSIVSNLHQYVRNYRVSSLVILRRAFDLNVLSHDEFNSQYNSELQKHGRAKKSDGGDFHRTLAVRNSTKFIKALLSSTLAGRTTYSEAAYLLGVKVKTLDLIANDIGL